MDPLSFEKLDPDPHKVNADPKTGENYVNVAFNRVKCKNDRWQ
jgi:hypothetical protein